MSEITANKPDEVVAVVAEAVQHVGEDADRAHEKFIYAVVSVVLLLAVVLPVVIGVYIYHFSGKANDNTPFKRAQQDKAYWQHMLDDIVPQVKTEELQ